MNSSFELPALMANAAEYHQTAAGMYNFFSRLFHHELDEELYDLLRSWASGLPVFVDDGGAAVTAVTMVAELPERSEAILNLATLYARQFLGMHKEGKTVSLCQSVYTSPKGLTHQDALHSVRSLFRVEKLELAEHEDLPDDHLSVLLCFLGDKAAQVAKLSTELSLDGWKREVAALAVYREQLLQSWLGSVLAMADKLMPGSFYTVFLHYLAEFVEFDSLESGQILMDLSLCPMTAK